MHRTIVNDARSYIVDLHSQISIANPFQSKTTVNLFIFYPFIFMYFKVIGLLVLNYVGN